MSAWVVVPCLLTLREEFNKVSPKRDKGADGTIGDANHASTSDHTPDEDSSALRGRDSDHKNEVHALDIDSTGPWPDGKRGDIEGSWFDRKIHELVAEEKRRWLDPDDMCRLDYIIWRGYIYSRVRDFAKKKYTGADQHFDHAHFSARYETRAENDTRSWRVAAPAPIKEDDMPDIDDMRAVFADELSKRLDKIQKYDQDNKPITDNPYMGSAYALGVISRDAGIAARGVGAIVKAIAALDIVDETALAQELAPLVAGAVLAGLPEGVAVTPELIENAVKSALRSGTDS